MPKRPLLIFPKFVPVAREKLHPAFIPIRPIGRGWQRSEVADEDFAGTSNRLFALATNAAALAQLLSLWQRHVAGQKLDYGFGVWKQVFSQLREVRRWSVQDRLRETGIVE